MWLYERRQISDHRVLQLTEKNSIMCVIPGSKEDVAAHQVIDAVSRQLRSGSGTPEAFFRRAVAHKQTFHLQAAVDDFDVVIDRMNRHDAAVGRSHFFRGICHRRLGRLDEAIDDGNAAVALRPDDPGVFTIRGFALANVGRLDDAEHDFETALRLDPGHTLAKIYQGFNRFAAADYLGALQMYDEAMAMSDQLSFGPYLNRGITRLVVGDRTGAWADIRVAAELRTKIRIIAVDPRPNAYLALLHYLDGDLAAAHEQVQVSQHIGPDPMASLLHGLLEARHGEKSELRNLLQQMVAWHPQGMVCGTRDAARFMSDPVSIIPLLQPLTR